MMAELRRVRFAPSPTGHLHIGTARTALFNWLLARSSGGVFILRIEDTDPERSSAAYEKEILADLRWLGLDWDEGPDVGGAFGPYRQSLKRERYLHVAEGLIRDGRAYHCFCTAEELEAERSKALAEGRMPKYSGKCRSVASEEASARLAAGERATVRFRVPEGRRILFHDLVRGPMNFESEVIGDFVLLRSDGSAGYNFAVVVDDMDMRVTDVMRGDDHLTNTARHILLFEALGSEPPQFAHLSMIVGPDRAKLSKRQGSVSLGEYRQQGIVSEAIFNYLSRLSWSSPSGREVMSKEEIVEEFDVSRLSSSPAVFDQDKLRWLNSVWLRRLPAAEVASRARALGISLPENLAGERLFKAITAAVEAVDTLAGLPERLEVFARVPHWGPDQLEELRAPQVPEILSRLREALGDVGEISYDEASAVLKTVSLQLKDAGIKGKALFHPLRLALTGLDSGPEMALLISVWGGEETRKRLTRALDAILSS